MTSMKLSRAYYLWSTSTSAGGKFYLATIVEVTEPQSPTSAHIDYYVVTNYGADTPILPGSDTPSIWQSQRGQYQVERFGSYIAASDRLDVLHRAKISKGYLSRMLLGLDEKVPYPFEQRVLADRGQNWSAGSTPEEPVAPPPAPATRLTTAQSYAASGLDALNRGDIAVAIKSREALKTLREKRQAELDDVLGSMSLLDGLLKQALN